MESAKRATAELAEAKEAKGEADRGKREAETAKVAATNDFQKLSAQIGPLEKQVTSFKDELSNERLKVALEPTAEILAIEPVNAAQLITVLSRSDDFAEQRMLYAAGYAFSTKGNRGDRLIALSVLMRLESASNKPDLMHIQQYRNRMVSLTSNLTGNDEKDWDFLIENLGSDAAEPSICESYTKKWPDGHGSFSDARFIVEHYPREPDCMAALWDANDPDHLPAAHMREVQPYIEFSLAYCAANELRCESVFLYRGLLFAISKLNGLPKDFDVRKMEDLARWRSTNPITTKAFTEGGLKALRQCGRPIWELASRQIYVDDKELNAACPQIH